LKLTKNIRTTAVRVLLNESEAIAKLSTLLNEDFENCVQHLLESKGRLVITGVGKSAWIANKLVATLNSTGTPALFMHAADAIHGDLGMVQQDDTVLFISKSGNTAEIKVLLPLVKQLGVKIVALVSNRQSYLAEQAHYVLDATIGEEACPHNLTPTTSTTAHLALGDALAICLLEARGFTSSDFARFHPGGSLGKQLYLKVGDLLSKNQIPSVQEEASVAEVIVEISSKRLGATAVLDQSGSLKGIITDGDLRRMLQKTLAIQDLQASAIMTVNPKSIQAEAYATAAFALMKTHNITQLVVLDGEKLAGFVHIHDLMKEGIV
jgi:arabinose-5-phosphate isomerase